MYTSYINIYIYIESSFYMLCIYIYVLFLCIYHRLYKYTSYIFSKIYGSHLLKVLYTHISLTRNCTGADGTNKQSTEGFELLFRYKQHTRRCDVGNFGLVLCTRFTDSVIVCAHQHSCRLKTF